MFQKNGFHKIDAIKNTLQFLKEGEFVEVRILRTRNGTVSGYFNDYQILALTIQEYIGTNNIYITLNTVIDDVTARSFNQLTKYSSNTTGDKEISKLNYILIDLDPIRPSGISSNGKEHKAALDLAKIIRNDLMDFGITEPIYADSGNGAHLLICIDEDNTQKNVNIIQNFLKVLYDKYSTDNVEVDLKTYNPARVTKLYSTKSVKGSNTADRPHRDSKLLIDTSTFIKMPTPINLIEKYVTEHEKLSISNSKSISEINNKNSSIPVNNSEQSFNVEEWVESLGFHVVKTKDMGNYRLYAINKCMFDTGYDIDEGMFLTQGGNGFLGAKCLHSKCKNHDFNFLWKKYMGDKPNPNSVLNSKNKRNNTGNLCLDAKLALTSIISIFEKSSESLFMDTYGTYYVESHYNNQDRIIKFESNEYEKIMIKMLIDDSNLIIKKDGLVTARDTIKAITDVPVYKVYQRFAFVDGKYYYWLNNKNKEAVIIEPNSTGTFTWNIRQLNENDSCRFYCTNDDLEQFVPLDDGKEFMYYFNKYFSALDKNEKLVLAVRIVYSLYADSQFPINVFIGKQGSGKSTAALFIEKLINPTKTPLHLKPSNDEQLAVLLANKNTLCLDNVTKLNSKETDMLCVAVSGAVHQRRKLYTDSESVFLDLKAQLSMTSITMPFTATDLLDRSLIFNFPAIKQRRENNELMEEFTRDIPYMLYGLFDTFCKSLNIVKDVNIDNYIYRISSFEKLGSAISIALGFEQNDFRKALQGNINFVDDEIIDSNPLASIILNYVKDNVYIEMPANELLQSIKAYCNQKSITYNFGKINGAVLSRKLGELENALLKKGIEFSKKKSASRSIILRDITAEETINLE